nr:MAG TPA: hypothetical protein [Caudoviricetes sp.]
MTRIRYVIRMVLFRIKESLNYWMVRFINM